MFTLYTNDCKSKFDHCKVVKYADDTAIIGQIFNDDHGDYLDQVDDFVIWCDQNYLNLNVKKTKEMVFDFRKNRSVVSELVIKSESVERVHDYKYLGIVIDDKLSGSQNSQLVYSKCMQRVHHLRLLRNINIDCKILTLLYKSIIESILCFSITTWYGNISCQNKNKFKKIVRISCKLGADVTVLQDLYNRYTLDQMKKIMKDEKHPLNNRYIFLRSGRRLALPKIKTTRYKNSFIPSSIKLYNHLHN